MYLQKWGNRKFALFPKGLYLELLAFSTEDFETTGFVNFFVTITMLPVSGIQVTCLV